MVEFRLHNWGLAEWLLLDVAPYSCRPLTLIYHLSFKQQKTIENE